MCSDWLDEVWSHREDVMDDYQFVYMGPAGTWLVAICTCDQCHDYMHGLRTPFHADVLR